MQLLPSELLDHLFFFVPPAHLTAVSRTSSAYCSAAQRVLYRHLALSSSTRTLSCVLTLASNHCVASYVRSFTISFDRAPSTGSHFYQTLSCSLANMSQLTSLDIFVDQSASWILSNDTTYPNLQRFACLFNLDCHLVAFFNKSSSITELKIGSVPLLDYPILSSVSLPFLAHFTGSALAAELIVPGRPVHSIILNSGCLTENIAYNLAHSTAPIHTLSAHTISHSLSLISTLAGCMKKLQHLRIATTFSVANLPDTVSLILKNPTFFPSSHMISQKNIADVLTLLPDLQTCELWGFHCFQTVNKVWHFPSFNTPKPQQNWI